MRNFGMLPVTNAFCNCPLSPVAQGLTVATLLPRHNIRATIPIKAEPPIAIDIIIIGSIFDLDFCCWGIGGGTEGGVSEIVEGAGGRV